MKSSDRTDCADATGSGKTISVARQTFKKADRLLERSEFLRIGRLGKKTGNRHFIAYFYANHHMHCRLGVTVSRKVGNAAKRNRIKRLTREYFRQNRHMFKNHWDIHVIGKREAANTSNQIVFQSLEGLFGKIAAFHRQ